MRSQRCMARGRPAAALTDLAYSRPGPSLTSASTRRAPLRLGKPMNRIHVLVLALITSVAGGVSAPTAHASDSVTYEVIADQDNVPAANVEYNERSERTALQEVSLPWRVTTDVPTALSPTNNGAEIRAHWRPYRWPYKYVTVRIYLGDRLLCESTLDVGDATCYGSTPHRDFPQTGGE